MYLELMGKATLGQFSGTRSDSSQRTQHSHLNKHRALPQNPPSQQLQALVRVAKLPTILFYAILQ